jgi:hypothetical protein
MAVALSPELPTDAIEHLIVADIAPSSAALSTEFQGYIEAMHKVEQTKINSRREAQDVLAPYEPVRLLAVLRHVFLSGKWILTASSSQDPMTRAFLLTNLDAASQPFKFRVPLDIIGSSIPDLGSFPHQPGERSWHGKTLFVKGAKSRYINKNNIPIAKEFFPSMSLETLDTGHWGTCRCLRSKESAN